MHFLQYPCGCFLPNTPRGTLEAPPLSVAFFGWISRYFFFAAFLAAFLAGFLAAFLVAILPILPFRWVASISCNKKLQLKRCIDLCCTSVKQKTMRWWKKEQQFLR
jgi:hypothetical protein